VLIAVFAVAATTMTFFHLDPFLAHPWYHLAYWLSGYAVLVVAAPAVLLLRERRDGGRLPVEEPLSPAERVLGGAAGLAMGTAALALLVDPVWFSGAWPWDVAPLTGRLLGVWLAAFAAAWAWALWDGDRHRARPLIVAAPITGVLLALVPLVHAGDVRAGAAAELAVYYALAVLVAAPGLGLLTGARTRRPAAHESLTPAPERRPAREHVVAASRPEEGA
jgi:hypothetical protein